jgi:hypothetical protein
MTSVHANQSELSRGHPSRATIFKHLNPSVGVPKQMYELLAFFLMRDSVLAPYHRRGALGEHRQAPLADLPVGPVS